MLVFSSAIRRHDMAGPVGKLQGWSQSASDLPRMELVFFHDAFVGLPLTLDSVLENVVLGGELQNNLVFTQRRTRILRYKAHPAADLKLVERHGSHLFRPFWEVVEDQAISIYLSFLHVRAAVANKFCARAPEPDRSIGFNPHFPGEPDIPCRGRAILS
jgi:hypothetical protein